MSPDKDRALRERYPLVFQKPLGNDEPLRTGDGWFDLLDATFNVLDVLIACAPESERHHYYAQCVKEKFGGLRIYFRSATAAMTEVIALAEHKSLTVCDVCGKTGQKRSGAENFPWVRTRCDEHVDWRQSKDGFAHAGGTC